MTYGIAKANAFMGILIFKLDNYIKLVANSDKNLKALLDWKSKRDKWLLIIQSSKLGN